MENSNLKTEVEQLLIKIKYNPTDDLVEDLKEILVKEQELNQQEVDMLKSEIKRLSSL